MENNYTNLTPQEEAELFSQVDMHLVDALRFFLLREEQEKREKLENEIVKQNQHIQALEEKSAQLEEIVMDDSALTASIEKVIATSLRRQIKDDRERMVQTMGPIVGDMLRIGIQEDKSGISDALHPVIGNDVSRSVRRSLRTLQKEIDKRLSTGRNLIASAKARIRGVTPGAMALRESLPLTIKHVFLIQQGSGILMSHYKTVDDEEMPPSMVTGMLTAILSFASDAFGNVNGDDSKVYEIDYGNERILIEEQEFAYIAIVIDGTEPIRFRDDLRDFVSDLHIDYRSEIRDYSGGFDTALDTEMEKKLEMFASTTISSEASEPKNISPEAMFIALGSLTVFIGGLLFFAYFIFRLLPYVFATTSIPSHAENVRTEPLVVVVDYNEHLVFKQPHPLRMGAVVYNRPNGVQTGSIEAGTIISIINTSGDWSRVAWHDETTPEIDVGWIRNSLVQQ